MNPETPTPGVLTPGTAENPPEPATQPQQQAPQRPRHTCRGCSETWTGLSTAHCGACHRTFTGIGPFDLHRSQHGDRGACLDPATITTRDGRPRLTQRPNGRWGGPELTDAQRIALARSPRR